jgi:hypothetical protein
MKEKIKEDVLALVIEEDDERLISCFCPGVNRGKPMHALVPQCLTQPSPIGLISGSSFPTDGCIPDWWLSY